MSANEDEFVVVGPSGFGKAIREFRHQRGLTQHQLADLADMHRSYLARLESGSATQALQQINRALAALGLEVVVRIKDR